MRSIIKSRLLEEGLLKKGLIIQPDVVTPPTDTTKPVITLTGPATVNVTQGETYTELGATWTDNVDGSGNAVITGTVDTSTVGNYMLYYNYTDVAGNVADTVTRSVVVAAASVSFTINKTVTLNRNITFKAPSTESVTINGVEVAGNDNTTVNYTLMGTGIFTFELSSPNILTYLTCTGMGATGGITVLSNAFSSDVERIGLNLNSFTGDMPDYSSITNLDNLVINGNNLTGIAGSAIKVNASFYANVNSFSSAAVDEILGALVAGGTINATVYLTGNGIPTATGEVHIDTLRADGCTVTVEGGY